MIDDDVGKPAKPGHMLATIESVLARSAAGATPR
jgi:hypothetical protein